MLSSVPDFGASFARNRPLIDLDQVPRDLGHSRLQQILVLSREHELVSLIMDSNRGSDDAVAPVSLQIDDFQCRVQGVARMDFFEEGAGELNERNEGLANVMREKRCARGCK